MSLLPHRYFSENPQQAEIAQQLYEFANPLPLVNLSGRISAKLFSNPDFGFNSPVDLLILNDPNIYRMLYSAGAALEQMGLQSLDDTPTETDPRNIWQLFAAHYYLFRGTAIGNLFEYQLDQLFGVDEKLTAKNAQSIFDQIEECLHLPEYQPRALFDSFNLEILATQNDATDSLDDHAKIRLSDWGKRIIPTFCPDNVTQLDRVDWRENIQSLSALCEIDIVSYGTYLRALALRRRAFRAQGAVATLHTVQIPYTTRLTPAEADEIFQRALRGDIDSRDVMRFTAHMLTEMARMSCDDGLVMQLRAGIYADYNPSILKQFGRGRGADMPLWLEFTRNLKTLLDLYGNHPNFTLVIMSTDEHSYSRELASIAGHFPSVKLGSPIGHLQNVSGYARYFSSTVESAGLYNTAGFTGDVNTLSSLPAWHDMWRRSAFNWIAGLVVKCQIDMDDAFDMSRACVYELSKTAYNL